MKVHQQTLADRHQIRAGFLHLRDRLRTGQHTQKRVLAQVCRIPGIAQAPPQPAFQPATVVAVQAGKRRFGGVRRDNSIIHGNHLHGAIESQMRFILFNIVQGHP